MSITERVLDVLEHVAETNVVRLEPELKLFDRGVIDSLGMVELIVELSTEFDIDIAPSEIDRNKFATPRQIVAYMESRLGP